MPCNESDDQRRGDRQRSHARPLRALTDDELGALVTIEKLAHIIRDPAGTNLERLSTFAFEELTQREFEAETAALPGNLASSEES